MLRGHRGAVLWACLIMTGATFGAGFQLYTEGSAEALGQAGAVSGRDDLISLAWYNPAALAGYENAAVMGGVTCVSIRTDFTSVAGNASMYNDWRPIPHLYYIQPVSDELTAMLSINAPYGLITEWPPNWAGAALAIYSDLHTVYTTPSLAWKMTEDLSVSAGFNVVYGEAELTRTGVGVEGDDIGYGGTLSTRYQFHEEWALGARYQSRVNLKLEGDANGAVPITAGLTLPSSVNAGIANSSIDHLSLGLDIVWTEWSTYDYLTIPEIGVNSPKLWSDVISIRIGGEYALNESWVLRAGYVWDESPVPDTTRAPELPGSDRQMVMAGEGWKTGGVGIDLAYSFLWADEAGMGTIDPLPGTFDTTTHLVAVSASYAF